MATQCPQVPTVMVPDQLGHPDVRARRGLVLRCGRRLGGRVVALAAAILLVTPSPGVAAPADPPVGDAPTEAALAAEVERLGALVAAADDQLRQHTVDAEASADAVRAAQDSLASAESEAVMTSVALQSARSAVERSQSAVTTLARETFMGATGLQEAAAVLDAGDPEDVLDRAATLDVIGQDRTERLVEMETARAEWGRADEAARSAVAERDSAARAAAVADAAAQEGLAEARRAHDAVAAEKAGLEEQLRAAGTRMLAARGAEDPAASWDQQQRQEEARAIAGTASLVAGRVTSCYGSRGGTQHNGMDIAAPIGTPISAPDDGVVLHAGAASGFGLAVYLQHPDGTITVYGHIDRALVVTGQRVVRGQVIAEVGNRGQSTGPHLHIEAHTGGLYQERVDPVPWLAERGVTVGSSCG